MSKRKFKKGAPVMCVDDFLKHDWFIVCGKTYNAGWCRSWPLNLAHMYVKHAFVAERLTNEEFYAGKNDEQLKEMLKEELCEFCPVPESQQGLRNYGDGPSFCIDTGACKVALEAWKKERVE